MSRHSQTMERVCWSAPASGLLLSKICKARDQTSLARGLAATAPLGRSRVLESGPTPLLDRPSAAGFLILAKEALANGEAKQKHDPGG